MHFGEILKWYPNSYKDSITIHQLLSHQSGIINYTNLPNWPEMSSKKYSKRDFVDFFAKASLEFNPGTNFSYSNSNYYILGLVAEELTGIPYEKLLNKYIFDPMKMNNSYTSLNYENIESSVAKGFERLPYGYIETAPLQDYSTSFSVSGIYSTAEDLFNWTNGFFNNSILTDTTKELMTKPNQNSYGYGFVISQVNSNEITKIFSNPFTNFICNKGDERLKIIWHWGSNPGYNSLIARITSNNFTLIILENITQLKSDKETMIYDLAEEIINYMAK